MNNAVKLIRNMDKSPGRLVLWAAGCKAMFLETDNRKSFA